MTADELQGLMTQIESYHRVIADQSRVHFEAPEAQTIADFLSCFGCQTSSTDTERTTSTCSVSISPNISETKKYRLGIFRLGIFTFTVILNPHCDHCIRISTEE